MRASLDKCLVNFRGFRASTCVRKRELGSSREDAASICGRVRSVVRALASARVGMPQWLAREQFVGHERVQPGFICVHRRADRSSLLSGLCAGSLGFAVRSFAIGKPGGGLFGFVVRDSWGRCARLFLPFHRGVCRSPCALSSASIRFPGVLPMSASLSGGRGRVVRARRRPDPRVAALTALDRRVLEQLCWLRVVTQEQLGRLFPDVPDRTLRYRTRRLYELGWRVEAVRIGSGDRRRIIIGRRAVRIA